MCRLFLCRFKPSYSEVTILKMEGFLLRRKIKIHEKPRLKLKQSASCNFPLSSLSRNVLSKSTTLEWCQS